VPLYVGGVKRQDMNEPANFGTNEERPWNWPEDDRPYWSLKCPTGHLDDPPYRTSSVAALLLHLTDKPRDFENLYFTI